MGKPTVRFRLMLPSPLPDPRDLVAELRVEDLGIADAEPVALGRTSVRTRLPAGADHLDLQAEVRGLSTAVMPTVWAHVASAAASGPAIRPGDLITTQGTDPRKVGADGICRVRLAVAR